ncbi:hypothetical protein MHYP_G00020550 [Metynnis hypsauchen]
MEFPGVSQEGFSPPRKLQCPPVLPVSRRSVEVRRWVKEVFNTAGAESAERQKERRSRRAECLALSSEDLFGRDSAEDSESDHSDDWLAALGAQLPEVTVYKKHKEKETTTTFEPPRESVHPVYKVNEADPQKVKVTEKAGRRFSSKLLADGCDAGLLRDEMRGKWKRNSPASFSSPSETLADLLYRNAKRVFDCALTGGKGRRPDLPPTSYVKRKEKTKLTEMWRDEGGTSLHLKATARSTRSDRDGGTDTYRDTKHNETMQFCMWGKPGSGAPNLGSVRRTDISSAGIVPQEQLRGKGFCGTPFHLHVK